jgi:immunity protein Imm1 of predicted polymorphic toxin system
MKQSFHIPDEFREVMREVTSRLDWIDDRTELVGPDAVDSSCARGGRVEGTDVFRFTYFGKDGHSRVEIELHEQQIRDIAGGHLSEIDVLELDPHTRTQRGEPLLVWGEYDDDALRIRTLGDLELALDMLQAIGSDNPCLIRLWSDADDQVVCVLNHFECTLYVVASKHGYGTSVGDPTRRETFELVDHDVGGFSVPWNTCLPWRVVRAALLQFVLTGELGDGVILDGTIPSQLLVLGDFDRAAELATRRPPPVDPAKSSLVEKSPHGPWAQRLLDSLIELQLIEVDLQIVDAIRKRLTMLLTQFGHDAQDSVESANQLAKQLEKVRGVGALFATGGDLQIALRRTQDPPTMPVEIPFT